MLSRAAVLNNSISSQNKASFSSVLFGYFAITVLHSFPIYISLRNVIKTMDVDLFDRIYSQRIKGIISFDLKIESLGLFHFI